MKLNLFFALYQAVCCVFFSNNHAVLITSKKLHDRQCTQDLIHWFNVNAGNGEEMKAYYLIAHDWQSGSLTPASQQM